MFSFPIPKQDPSISKPKFSLHIFLARYIILFLFYFILFYIILFYFILFYFILFYFILFFYKPPTSEQILSVLVINLLAITSQYHKLPCL